ncbi:EB module family protein [Trichinella spiralis]|uniref:EB module family protein n=1 Tax=Trichinella spiralis TaxID=6334 RepID=UPI0001EFE4D3|nr:EB module family protein [Trichinella spiralis]
MIFFLQPQNVVTFLATEIGDHCNKSEQCHGQMMCAQQFCTPAEPTDTVCGQQRDCKANQICKYGVCWKAAMISCHSNKECPNKMHCKNRICALDSVTESYCSGGGNPLYHNGFPVQCDVTAAYKTCPRGYSCDKQTGLCCAENQYEKELGDSCMPNAQYNQCRPVYSACIDYRCQCVAGYEQLEKRCVINTSYRKRLGEPCLSSSECENAYSHCKNGVCTCRPQFINHRGLCEPGGTKHLYALARNCPLDFPLIQNGRLFQCIIDEQRLDGQIDNCPKDFFCVADTVQNTQTQNVLNKNLKGFCCPKMASVCPVGSAYSAADMDCYRFCPRETHHCYRGGDFKWRPTCCPIPCSAGYVNQNGYCMSASSPKSLTQAFEELNKECNDDRDCTSKNFICKGNICQCNEHYYFNGFECVVPKCRYGIPMFNNDGTPVRCETICPKKLNICDKTYKICCDLSQLLYKFLPMWYFQREAEQMIAHVPHLEFSVLLLAVPIFCTDT